jgi:hypothetical protein
MQNVGNPVLVRGGIVARKATEFDAALLKVGLALGGFAEFGGAHGRKVAGCVVD